MLQYFHTCKKFLFFFNAPNMFQLSNRLFWAMQADVVYHVTLCSESKQFLKERKLPKNRKNVGQKFCFVGLVFFSEQKVELMKQQISGVPN